MAAGLMLNYTKRMTGARNDAVHVYKYLTNAGVPCGDIYGKDVLTNGLGLTTGSKCAFLLRLSFCPWSLPGWQRCKYYLRQKVLAHSRQPTKRIPGPRQVDHVRERAVAKPDTCQEG